MKTPRFCPTTVLLAACLVAPAGAGCLRTGAFMCRANHECGPEGRCESTGACSFDDVGRCLSGRRYGKYAPEGLAGQCVDHVCAANRVVTVRAGAAHACLVKQNGAVACWGAGASGQLGDGTTVSRSTATDVMALGVATDVALGDRHTCALLVDGSVWCWGANESGQLGGGAVSDKPALTPQPVRNLRAAVAIAAGGAFTCAADAAGVVSCWGANGAGELGAGVDDATSIAAPVAVVALPASHLLAARDRHICAVTDEGRVFCWGSNTQGELGDGSQTPRRGAAEVTALSGEAMSAVAVGAAHTCAVGAGRLWCWGANQAGQIGNGDEEPRYLPVLVPLGSVTDVAAGAHHTCATDSSGTAWCWGANPAGQLGEGTTSGISVPVPVTSIQGSVAVTAGDAFSCARSRDGTVWCWGDDRMGQLGIGSDIDRLAPVRVSVERALAITAGGGHTCALRPASDGAAVTVCWGDNQAGQLGDGTRLDHSAPVALKIGLNAREVVAGAMHSCLGGGDGSVWCWGRGGSGQLGTTSLIDSIVPVTLPGLNDASRIAAGQAHTCAVRNASALCWGANDDGQLGDGTNRGRSAPAPVAGIGPVAQVVAGGGHTCARLVDGSVMCWGRGAEGQLGNNAFDSGGIAVVVSNLAGEAAAGLSRVIQLAAGKRHTCAVSSDGGVSCWGDGSAGQLGWRSMPAAANRRPIPVAVVGLQEAAVDITAGDEHTCVRTSPDGNSQTPGAVYCWGANGSGQLGNGNRMSTGEAAGPVPVGGVVAIAAGGAHTCALKSDQSAFCWGSNSAGQLGDGAKLQYLTAQATRVSCP